MTTESMRRAARRVLVSLATVSSLVVALATLGPSSCASTDIGNPEQQPARVTTSFTADEQATAGGLVLDSGLELSEAWLAIGAMRIVSGPGCTEVSEIALPQTLVVELFGGSEHPSAPVFEREPGSYCRIELALTTATAEVLPVGAPDDLIGRSTVVLGKRTDGIDFVLRDDAASRISLDAVGAGFALVEGEQALLVGFAPQGWLELGMLDGLLGGLLGETLVLEPLTHPDLLAAFRTALVDSAALYRDADADGALDADERTPIATSSP